MQNITFNLVKISLVLLCMSMFSVVALSQRIITGTVYDDETGETLIGATIVDKANTSLGTTTDFDGNFSINIDENTKVLTVSYVGYNSFEVVITAASNYTVRLSEGRVLEEVVVIGYGTVKREDVTGSIQTVSSEDFNKGAITSPQQLLAGKVPGVSITSGGGPDDGAAIRIRGESSLSASNDPLIVIDGIPVDNGGISGNRNPLNIINPNDIESMTVLKDASATAIYGSRAAGGVILITTKKGQGHAPLSVTYNGNVSFGNTANRVDVLTPDEYRAVLLELFPERDTLLGSANTDWQDEIYRTTVGTDHNVNVSGGVKGLPYRLSVGYTDMKGLLKSDQFKRYTGSLNLSPSFFDNTLQVNAGIKAMLSDNKFADRGAIGAALNYDPTRPIYDENSPFLGGYSGWYTPAGVPVGLSPTNPLSLLDRNLRADNSSVQRYIANASVDYRFPFLKQLRANLNLGYDHSFGEGTTVIPGNNSVAYSYDAVNGGGHYNEYDHKRTNSVLEFYLNYKNDFGDHAVDIMGGYSWQKFYDISNSFRSDAAGTEGNTTIVKDAASELYLLSLFGRANYGYKNFLLTVTLRGDATSRFAPENRWGLFPAVAAGYKLVENSGKYLNSLKIRAGWGITGQQEIGSRYEYMPRYSLSLENAQYQFGNNFLNTYRPNGYDRNIKWEETTTYNLGFDFSIINSTLWGSLDLYQRNTKDLLNFISVPAGTNLTNKINTNIGDMLNRGVELGIFAAPIKGDNFRWDIGMNIAYNYNEITKLTSTDDPDYIGEPTGGIGGGIGNNIQIHTVGFSPYSFYVYEQAYDENGNIIPGQFVDRNDDGIIDDLDKYRLKRAAPLYILGITSGITFRNFDFSFAGRANFGNYVYNNVATEYGYTKAMVHPNSFLTNIHSSGVDNGIENQADATFSDHFVENGSFFRMDHITLGYTLENKIGKAIRIYATLQNAFVITKYSGLDPEVFGGIDGNVYPRPRTLVFGLSATF